MFLENVAYGPHERNVMDVWLLESDEPAPLVIHSHGGGWMKNSKESFGPDGHRAYWDRGISVASTNYRYSTQAVYPAPFRDVARALQFARSKSAEWNIDPTRVGLTGRSAGAVSSLWTAFGLDLADPAAADPVERESTRVACAAVENLPTTLEPAIFDELFGVATTVHPAFLSLFGLESPEDFSRPGVEEMVRDASPIRRLTKDAPPVCMHFTYAREPVDEETPPSVVVHHPEFGLWLQAAMTRLGLECHVSYPGCEHPRYAAPVDFFAEKLVGAR